ncbi:toxin [Pseudomonas sp. SWRI153]|uniref:Toxin n=1 Tax=Pseudomonas khorasanensis TaxID=2745508 RepID=A0A923F303_9PSED|nr:TcdA/TcdB pore-forming domain-containing protein [Pseudomonas khorasanensis]MBV4486482.1 toxin [Pseudomonas khorasanensis]
MKVVDLAGGENYIGFNALLRLTDFEQALLPYKGSQRYGALLRYYAACVDAKSSQQLLEPLGLLRQTLEQVAGSMRMRREVELLAPASQLSQVYRKVEDFESHVQSSAALIKVRATPVPNILHFVWLGGGVGEIQRDYLNVWKQVLAGHGYTLNLWHDSDALLAYQTNKLIVEAAKADALAKVAGKEVSENELATLFEERAIILKQQMFAHISAATTSGESADGARIDLLVSAYGQNAAELESLKMSHRSSLLALADGNLQLRDLHGAVPLQLQDIYARETGLRGNLAAASDVVRAEVLHGEGGSYADVDNLPPLSNILGSTDISAFGSDARVGVLQLLLDHNSEWMPGRQKLRSRYASYLESIPAEHLAALQGFAKSSPSLAEVFQAPADRLARPFALRAVAEGGSMSNAFLMAHPGAAMLQTLIERFRFNYDLIDATARLGMQRGIALSDFDRLTPVAEEVLAQTYGVLEELATEREISARLLASAAAGHFSDGIRLQSEWTIYLTGPGAMRDGMADYERAHLTPADAQAVRRDAAIAALPTINRNTEEEQDHSWKDNETDPLQWVKKEQQRWQEGSYKTRYAGDITELLLGSTIEFEQGWPLIEGRAVLLTQILQRLVDGLGDRFVEAMRLGHDGAITFEEPLPLSFADRQLIRHQPLDARPAVYPRDRRSLNLGLDEVLSGMAQGELSLAEITPLQRLALGALLGIDSLHDQGFEAVRGQTDNLANSVRERGASSRYAVIERHLYTRKEPAFLAGLVSHITAPAASVGALALKKAALTKAHSLQQWGRYVAQIQQAATLEHRLQIAERVDQVFGQLDVSSVLPVPQDLLVDGVGESIGGRCYPLTLMMAAAFATGEEASRRLRERFYLAVMEPQQNDSIVFLQALEELQGTRLSEVGTTLLRADVAQITAALADFAVDRTLLLNSDNHSLLVAKTRVGEKTLFHFYDPNFGVFEFETPAMLQRALEHLLLKMGMAKYYAAYGTEIRPTFDLIELQGERVAALSLSAGFKVARVLSGEPLPGQPAGRLRQRMNSAHGRSLTENAHLGASLLGLDSHWWGRQIAHATQALQALHASTTPLVPLFETLQITPDGKYQLSLVDPAQPERVVQVLSDDHRLLRIKNWLSEQFSTLARKPTAAGTVLDPTEAGSVHTLNAGFTIQALMNALRARDGDSRTLTTAVRLHAYVNYAQLVHGNVVDVVGLIRLVRTALNEQKVITRTVAPVVSEALGHVANEGVGAVLGLANVGFDIYQLATVEDDVAKAQFGTQLAFDSASLALTAGGVAAAVAGASTAAAVLGGAGVILGGLAVGVAALAQGFAEIARDAQAVGDFFADMELAYRGVGYHFDAGMGAWIADPALTVSSIDLEAGKIVLDSAKLYPLRDHFGVPDFDPDYDRAIDIRKQLNLPRQKDFAPPANQTIVLPATPQICYGYDYKALPFSTLRHDRGFATARRLERKKADGQWLFLFSFYSFPSHYIVQHLVPVYRDTVISVNLDAVERALVVPTLPSAWKGKLAYRISGQGASCTVTLTPGVSLELHAPSLQQCRWVLQAGWAREADIHIERSGELNIGNVRVTVSGRGHHLLLIRTGDHQLFSVDLSKRRLNIIEQSAPEGLDEQALLKHYRALAHQHRLVLPYTPVHDWLIPFESPQQPRYTTAWYDAYEDRFLYIRNDRFDTDDAQLALVAGESAWFYAPESLHIWQVDAVSGLLKHRYRLLFAGDQSTIGNVRMDTHGVIHLEQSVSDTDGSRQFGYLIHDGQLLLSSVTHDLAQELQSVLLDNETLNDWDNVLGKHLSPSAWPETDGFTTVDWQPAPYVSVCWQSEPNKRDITWIRSRDRLLIRPLPSRHHARGWPDSIKKLNDLVLLPLAEKDDAYVVYNRLHQTLCWLRRAVVQGKAQWSHRWVRPEGLKQVVAVESGYLVLDEEGRFFNLTTEGDVQLGGLGEQWFKDRPQWWLALAAVAKRYPVMSFALLGLRNISGDGSLSAWYVNDRVLLCDPGHSETLRLLGVTPDQRSGWLFSVSSGEILKQALVDPLSLDRFFATGTRLLHADALPQAQAQWADWRFADVTVDGSNLRGTTVEGVLLRLRDQAPEVVVGVNRQWVNAQGESLVERLRALLREVAHGDFVSVESAPDTLRWYDTRSARLLSIHSSTLPKSFDLLGTQTQSGMQTKVLLHEQREDKVQVYPGMQSFGPFDYFQRNEQVMTIEGHDHLDDLLPLMADDVRTVVLRLGQGNVTCLLSRAAWLRLDSIVIDCRHDWGAAPAVPGKLIWEHVQVDDLLFEIVADHLIIIDPATEHSLIFRDVRSVDPALRADVFLAFNGQQPLAISGWVQRVQAGKADTARITLQTLMAEPAIAE